MKQHGCEVRMRRNIWTVNNNGECLQNRILPYYIVFEIQHHSNQ